MKKLVFISVLGILALTGCQRRPDKTIANLQSAVVNEITAHARYSAYAAKAREEGLEPVAKLFDAFARSEKIHTERFKEYLDELDVNILDPKPTYKLASTKENLVEAIKSENNEINVMYPKLISEALSEKKADIAETMNWAYLSEKKNLSKLTKALDLLLKSPDSLSTLPVGYMICPLCGNSYESSENVTTCSNCNTTKELFSQL
jgi:rubrerythrin